jgi:adenylate kinase
MFNLVIFGAPGSGKGTQSDLLVEKYGLLHISTGDLLRHHMKHGTELGKIAEEYINKGNLIPDDLMLSILAAELEAHKEVSGVIFDGFPRTVPQAEALRNLLAQHGEKVNVVVGLEVADDELVDRLVKRGEVSGRKDDTPETITKRLEVYHTQTSPLKEFYTAEKLYHPIVGTGSIDDIFGRIAGIIDAIH